MRNGTYALYLKKEYNAGFKNDGRIILRSKDERDLENGFEFRPQAENWPYIKYVDKSDVQAVYDVLLKFRYKSYEGYVFTEKGDQVLIVIHGLSPYEADKLKMDGATDNGIYEKWVDKDKVELWEEIEEYKI